MVKKKIILFLSVVALAFSSLACQDFGEETTIFVASDIHYLPKELYDNGEAFLRYSKNTNGRNFIYIEEVVKAFVDEVIEKSPTALVISGDLTNNGEKISHEKLAKELKRIKDETDTKVYVIPGNHDVNNPWARKFFGDEQIITDSVSPTEFAEIYKDLGYQDALSRDPHTLSYLVAPSDDLWLIMLDTNMYHMNIEMGHPTTNGVLFQETLDWIMECGKIAEENGARLITSSHHNLLKHSENKYFGYTLNNYEEVLELFEDLNIPINLSGHIHAQSIKNHDYKKGVFYDIATGTMSSYPTGYGILKYKEDKNYIYEIDFVDVENWAKIAGEKDNFLLNFNEYSKNLYLDGIYDRIHARLAKEGLFKGQELEEQAKTLSLENLEKFSGKDDGYLKLSVF